MSEIMKNDLMEEEVLGIMVKLIKSGRLKIEYREYIRRAGNCMGGPIIKDKKCAILIDGKRIE